MDISGHWTGYIVEHAILGNTPEDDFNEKLLLEADFIQTKHVISGNMLDLKTESIALATKSVSFEKTSRVPGFLSRLAKYPDAYFRSEVHPHSKIQGWVFGRLVCFRQLRLKPSRVTLHMGGKEYSKTRMPTIDYVGILSANGDSTTGRVAYTRTPLETTWWKRTPFRFDRCKAPIS
jgi:hypothetical protein